MPHDQYKMPDRLAKEDDKLGWLTERVQDGTNFLKVQHGYRDIAKARDIIAGIDDEKVPSWRSKVKPNRLKRQIREIVAILSNLSYQSNFKTDNRNLYKNTEVLNKLYQAWWYNTFVGRGLRSGMQYASVDGTGYVSPVYKRDLWTAGRGDLFLDAYGADDVLPIQLPKDHNLQRAYMVILRNEVPINMAHAMYPTKQDLIVPDRGAPSAVQKGLDKVQKFLSPVLDRFGRGGSGSGNDYRSPTVDIYHAYTMDMTYNDTGRVIPMGKPGTSWEYLVPYYSQEIPAGKDFNGNVVFRKATVNDALMYPMRRLTEFTNSCILNDDSSPWWHGMVPAVQLRADDWPWEFLGYSLVRDNSSLQDSIVKNMRNIDNAANARMQPSLQFDTNAVARKDMEALDPLRPNQKLGVNAGMGEFAKTLYPAEYYDVPGYIPEHIKKEEEMMDHQLALRDLIAMSKAQRMGGDQIEKIMEMAGPIVQDFSHNIEWSMEQLGSMMKYNFFQFYNSARKLQILGPQGIVQEEYDFDPGNMVPSHMPGEDTSQESSKNSFERAKMHADNFYYQITPGSLLELTQMSRKMMYLQAQRAGVPLDPWTIAEVLGIKNFGPPPEGATTVMERWVAFERMKGEMAEAMGGNQPHGGAHGGGRTPTGANAPRIKSKDGGGRSTITESK